MWLLFASASAVCFGLRGILYQWSSRKPVDRNLLLLSVYLTGMSVSLIFMLALGQPVTAGAYMGLVMGVFSFAANAAMYKGFAEGKASVVAIFTGLPPVVVVCVAYVLWGETLTLLQTAAFTVIVAGILFIRYSNDISLNNLQGIHWAIIAMLCFGVTDLSSKQSMIWEADVFPTLFFMYATGSLLFLLVWLLQQARAASAAPTVAAARPASSEEGIAAPEGEKGNKDMGQAGQQQERGPLDPAPRMWSPGKTLLWGMIVGTTNISGMILVLPAFRLGVTGLVSAVIAMNVLLILLYARFFLKETFGLKEKIGLTLAIAGILLLRLTGG